MSVPTLKEFWVANRDLATDGVKPRTAAIYVRAMERRVLPVLGDRPLDVIRKSDVRRLLLGLERAGLSFSSQTDALAVLSRLFEVVVDDGLLVANPARGLRRRRPKDGMPTARALTPGELVAFLEHCPDAYRPVVAALAFTGCRVGEAAALTPADVDLERGVIVVSRSLSPDVHGRLVEGETKSGRARAVPVLPQLRPFLVAALDGTGMDERVFVGPSGGALNSSNLSRGIRLREWRDEVKHFPAGEKPLRLHDLRHTALTLMFQAGVPANVVQAVAGHSSLAVTSLYTGANEAAAVAAGEAFGVFLEKSTEVTSGVSHAV